jgi:two-component system CheB/CheR fusion protein
MRIYPYIRHNKNTDGVILTFVDITALKELNNILAGVFNASQNGIMAFRAVRDEEGQVSDFVWLAANNTTSSIFRKTNADLVGHTMKATIPEVAKNGLFARCLHVVSQNEPMRFEYFLKDAEHEKWFDVVVMKMTDGVVVTFNDITDKKEAEDKLRTNYNELVKTKEDLKKLNVSLEKKVAERTRELSYSEERFRLVSKATNDAIIDWDLINNQLWLSDSFYNIFGYTPERKDIRRNYWLNKIHPNDRQRVNASIDKAINNNSRQWSEEYRFQVADGSYADVLDRGYILQDEYGTPYRMLNSMMDVTKLKKAQQEIQENISERKFLAEAMPLIVWTASPVGKISFLNQHFTTYTGLPVQQGRELAWKAVIMPEHLAPLKAAWKAAIRNNTDFELELKLRNRNGEYNWHLLRAQAMRNRDGSLKMWVGTTTDINEQKIATEIMERKVEERTLELRRMNNALEMSNHDLQQFASVASHDLKEPLRKIHIFSNMLKDKYAPMIDGGVDYIDRIINSSARMTNLINDLLAFSRLSVNSLFRQVDLNLVVNGIMQDLELAIEEKDAKVTVSRLPVIEAIPGQMRQLFQNIISNALKFTRPGVTPVINIENRLITIGKNEELLVKPGEYCEIKISDNGVGFDEQYADKIFTIFQRLHTKNEYDGTGIGLAICKKIVEKHNGHIMASSKLNHGTTFTITLPVLQSSFIVD